MKTFKEYINEASGTYEIPTTKAAKHKAALEKDGHIVQKADDEGLVVKTSNVPKLKSWLLANGWDKEDIKAIF